MGVLPDCAAVGSRHFVPSHGNRQDSSGAVGSPHNRQLPGRGNGARHIPNRYGRHEDSAGPFGGCREFGEPRGSGSLRVRLRGEGKGLRGG